METIIIRKSGGIEDVKNGRLRKYELVIRPGLVKRRVLCYSLLTLVFVLFGNLAKAQLTYVLDMVHHNPGEAQFNSKFNNPILMKQMGYNGKVFYLFDSGMLGVDWQSVDPNIFPEGSDAKKWVDAKAHRLDSLYNACKAAGLQVYAMSDLVLLPKTLVSINNMSSTYGNINDTLTRKYLRLNIQLMFKRFPQMDGLVVRIGETYLQDAPYHMGSIQNPTDPDKTIIPLLQVLRDEICVKANKKLFFRTWYSFDVDSANYRKVSNAIEPHPNLILSVKHCEGDFHRGNDFSKVLGLGRHQVLIEVQCAREYEGKGAYPNYISNGVIEGFEEHLNNMSATKIRSIRDFYTKSNLLCGIWTWSKGGGWEGPFIDNEMLPELNAWVMAQWALHPEATEESLFYKFAKTKLGLSGIDTLKFRQLNLLAAKAIYRSIRSTKNYLGPWWTRDQYFTFPTLPSDNLSKQYILNEQEEAVGYWREMLGIAKSLQIPDSINRNYLIASCYYGLYHFRMIQAVLNLDVLTSSGDVQQIGKWLAKYNQARNDVQTLLFRYPGNTATIYTEQNNRISTADGEDPRSALPRFRGVLTNCGETFFDSTSVINLLPKVGKAEVLSEGTIIKTSDKAQIALGFKQTITASTALEFDFKTTDLTNSTTIGFGKTLQPLTKYLFAIKGSSDYKHYAIPIGKLYTGDFNFIHIKMPDAGTSGITSYIKNINVYSDADFDGVCDNLDVCSGDDKVDSDNDGIPDACDTDCKKIKFIASKVASYDATQDQGLFEVSADSTTLKVYNNGWKAYPLVYGVVSAHTMLEFDFKSDKQGEEHSIGFDDDLSLTNKQRFKLYGTQDPGTDAFTSYTNYTGDGNYKHYSIPVGSFLTGKFKYLVFTADHDAGTKDGTSYFKNIRLYNPPCDTGSSTVIIPTDIRNNNMDEQVTILPNPANNYLSVHTPWPESKGMMRVISLDGRLMRTVTLSQENQHVDTSEIPTGVYEVQIIVGNYIRNFKRIIVHE